MADQIIHNSNTVVDSSGFIANVALRNSGVTASDYTTTNKVDIASAARIGTHATGRPLYVTGAIGDDDNGIEFRHSNATQGLGFGYNSIYGAGTNASQNINLMPKGTTGRVGLGTATPAHPFHVVKPYTNSWQARFQNGTSNTYLSHGSGYGMHINTGVTNTTASYALDIRNSSQDGMLYVRNDGSVGMGTTTPSDRLDVVQNWFDTNTNNWGGGIKIRGTKPTLSFWETDDGSHRWMHHMSNGALSTYYRAAGGAFSSKQAHFSDRLEIYSPLHALGGAKISVQEAQDGGTGRGIYLWNDTDPNWGIYMGQSGAGRALDGGTATAGVGFNSHAIRFRVNNTTTQGFIFENAADQNLFSIRGSDGFAYFRGNMRIDGLPTNTGTNSDDIVVADANGNLKTTNVGVSEISYADRNYTFIPKNAQGGIAMIKAHTWVDEHWFGLLTWRNNGTGSSTIVSAVLTQLSQSGNLTPSVTTSGTGIVFSWTGQHTNPHGWTFTIIE